MANEDAQSQEVTVGVLDANRIPLLKSWWKYQQNRYWLGNKRSNGGKPSFIQGRPIWNGTILIISTQYHRCWYH